MRKLSKRKKILFFVIMLLSVLIISGFLGVIMLKVSGHWPRRSFDIEYKKGASAFEPDEQLGWKHKSGTHNLFISNWIEMTMTILADGSRRTSADDITAGEDYLMLGGSVTAGWAISDDETYAWKLQEKTPELKIINNGVGAYGTYQSLLQLERYLKEHKPPRIISYGFIPDHTKRNIASSDWVYYLESRSETPIYVPYCDINDQNELVRFSLTNRNFNNYLTGKHFDKEEFYNFDLSNRFLRKEQIQKKLFLELNKLSASYGSKFFVVLLRGNQEKKSLYHEFLVKNNINVADCRKLFKKGLIVPVDGHPNEVLHSFWAECIEEHIRKKKY